jgi:hypothetical protein
MQKLNISYPARRQPAGTVEVGVQINGREYYTYMAPGACNLRTFYGLNNINKHANGNPDAICAEIVAAIVLSGIGGSIMVFTDAYGKGADAETFAKFVHANGLGGVVVGNEGAGANPYMSPNGKVVAAIYNYNLNTLKTWYDNTFGAAENDGWVANQRTNMDWLFYQYGGRPHAADEGDKAAQADLEKSLEASRQKLKAKSAA